MIPLPRLFSIRDKQRFYIVNNNKNELRDTDNKLWTVTDKINIIPTLIG